MTSPAARPGILRRVAGLPSAVWLLGWVSLATDAASEAIYPVLPFFLTRVLGGTAVDLGLIEGFAEAANSLLKIQSGRLADRWARVRPLVIAGYGLSSLARPLIAFVSSWPQVLAVRFVDRIGKGIRGAPRDALLADSADPRERGLVFGFHRAMDHSGAIVGPLAATLFLLAFPGQYRALFLLTIVPGAIAVALIFRVPDRPRAVAARPQAYAVSIDPAAATGATSAVPADLRTFFIVLSVFTLGNSADAFLLLRLTDAAGSATLIPALWAALHVIKAIFSVAGGSLSDQFGRRAVIAGGWLVYAATYAGFAFSHGMGALVAWFLFYGLYFGFAEGTEKALVADLAPAALRGTAFGWYNAVTGIGALAASVVFGLIWKLASPEAAFLTGAALAMAATVLLLAFVRSPVQEAL